MLPLTHFCSLCKVPDDKDEQPLPNEPEKTEEVEESIEYEGIICMRLCNYLSTASNPDTLFLYAAGTQLKHEDLYAIQQQKQGFV